MGAAPSPAAAGQARFRTSSGLPAAISNMQGAIRSLAAPLQALAAAGARSRRLWAALPPAASLRGKRCVEMAQFGPATGIDLGTASCTIAVAGNKGVDIICNEVSNRETPTTIAFDDDVRCIGESAVNEASRNPQRSLTALKRLVGRKIDEAGMATELQREACQLVEGPGGEVAMQVKVHGKERKLRAEALLAMMLHHLQDQVYTDRAGCAPLQFVVVAVPGYWTPRQRQAVLDAAQIGGVQVASLLNEHAAVALAYGLTKKDLPTKAAERRHVLFIDFGHSALSATVAGFIDRRAEVLSVAFDAELGGRALDDIITQVLVAAFKKGSGLDAHDYPKALIRLRREAAKMKKVLSANSQASMNLECLVDDHDLSCSITRDELDEQAKPFYARFAAPLEEALASAGLKKEDLHSVEAVGNSRSVPAFKKAVSEWFGKDLSTTMSGSEACARGCALHAASLSPAFGGRLKAYELYDVMDPDRQRAAPEPDPEPEPEPEPESEPEPETEPEAEPEAEAEPEPQSQADGEETDATGDEKASGDKKDKQDTKKKNGKDKKPKKKEEPKPKPKLKLGPGLSDAELKALQSDEAQMFKADAEIFKKKEMRNTLEAYVLQTKSRLNDDWAPFAKDDVKTSFTKLLDEAEDWLYSDEGYDADLKTLSKQYSKVSKVGDPIEELFTEARLRPEAIANAKQLVEQVKASAEEMLAAGHVTPESAEQAIKKGKTLAKWLSDTESKQAKLDKTASVAVMSSEIVAKAVEYQQAAKSLLRKKPTWYNSDDADEWWTSVDLWAAVVIVVIIAMTFMPLASHDPRRNFMQYGSDNTNYTADPLGWLSIFDGGSLSIPTLVKIVQHSLFGTSESASAFFNVGLHSLNAIGVYRLAVLAVTYAADRKPTDSTRTEDAVCCAAAAIFGAAHPLVISTVAWSIGQPVLVACGFCLYSLHSHLKHRLSASDVSAAKIGPFSTDLVRSAVACLLALGSSSAAIGFPALLFAFDIHFLRSTGWQDAKSVVIQNALYSVGFAAVLIGLLTPATLAVGSIDADTTAATGSVLQALSFHAVKIIAPTDFRLRYPAAAPVLAASAEPLVDTDSEPQVDTSADAADAADAGAATAGSDESIPMSFDLIVCAAVLCAAVVCILGSALWAKFKTKTEGAMTTCASRMFNLLMLVLCFSALIVPLSLVETRDVEADLRDGYIPLLALVAPLLGVLCATVVGALDSDTPREFYMQMACAAVAASCVGAALWFGRDEQMLWIEPHKLWERDLLVNADDPTCLTNAGVELFKAAGTDSQRIEKAVRQHEEAAIIDPDGASTMHHYAVTLDRAERTAEALEQHEAALALSLPAPPALLVAYSRSLARAERLEEAVAAMRKAADTYGDALVPASIHTQTGELQAQLGEAAAAEVSFKSALELSPQYYIAMHGLAYSHREQQRWPEAEQHFEAAVKAIGRPRLAWSKALAHAQLQNGHALRKEDKLEEAQEKYSAAARNDPRMLAALNDHAVLLHRQGSHDEAVATFKQAVSVDKKSVVARLNLGVAYAASEDWRDAAHHLSRGVELDPTLTQTNAAMRRAIKTVEQVTCEKPAAESGWEDVAMAAMAAGKAAEAGAEEPELCTADIGLSFIE